MSKTLKKSHPKIYDLVKKQPVARFFYQGSHTHPVRRTVLIIEETSTMIRGYEFREGTETRTVDDALLNIKSYRKDRIPKWGDYKRLRMSYKTFLKNPLDSTLERFPILSMFRDGA